MNQGWWSVATETALGLSWDCHSCPVRIISATDGLLAGSLRSHLEAKRIHGPLHICAIESALTVYCLSIWTSLKCATWKGGLPFETQVLGLVGAGLGKGTVYETTSGD